MMMDGDSTASPHFPPVRTVFTQLSNFVGDLPDEVKAGQFNYLEMAQKFLILKYVSEFRLHNFYPIGKFFRLTTQL
jgi:hypothetical protein